MAVSPDGRYVAYTVDLRDGKQGQLWVRRLDSLEARAVTAITEAGGEGVEQPFWSPDSKSIGFFLIDKLKRVDLESGVVQTVCDVPGNNFGGSWGADGTIVFASSGTNGIKRVAAAGGTPTQVTTPDASAEETLHLWPKLLPDGRQFLYHALAGNERTTYVGSIDGESRVKVLSSDFMAEFAEPGYLLFVRDGALMAQRFDPVRFQLAGDPVVVSAAVQGVRRQCPRRRQRVAHRSPGLCAWAGGWRL
jgi:eukaryotic-like serine/threonine-protein kinase